MRTNPENDMECYVGTYFADGCNKEEFKDPGSVIYRTGSIISYANCPIIWVSQIHTKLALSTTEAEYMYLYQAMREV